MELTQPAPQTACSHDPWQSGAGLTPPLTLPRDFPPEPEDVFIFGYDSEDDIDEFADPTDSVSEGPPSSQIDVDVAEPQATANRTLAAELRELAQRAAAKLGVPAAGVPFGRRIFQRATLSWSHANSPLPRRTQGVDEILGQPLLCSFSSSWFQRVHGGGQSQRARLPRFSTCRRRGG